MEFFTVPDQFLVEPMSDVNILFYIRERGPDQVNLKLHYSQNMLCFMIHGVKNIIDESQKYSMNNEQIGLVTAGNMLMTERVTLRQEFESLLLFFSNEFLTKFIQKYDIRLDEKSSDSTPPVITFPKDEYLQTFQKSMKLLEMDFKNAYFRLAKIEEVLLYLLNKYPGEMACFINNAITKSQNNAITHVVQNHKFSNLKSEELAFLCNMSLSTFKRKFFEVYQTSPKKYMIVEKMKKARMLLLHNQRPSDIYYELGYENLSSFSLEFKKHYGVAPSLYPAQA